MDVSITIPAQTVTIPAETVDIMIPVAGIVYQNSWLNQTSGFSLPDMYAIPSNGLYRLTMGAYVSGTSGNCGVTGVISYPVTNTPQASWATLTVGASASLPNIPNNSNGACGAFEGISGLSVPLSVTVFGGILNYYDLYVTIEQLQ